MKFEIIPNNPNEALKWYEEKLKEVKEINTNCIKNGYEPFVRRKHGLLPILFINY